MHNFKMIRRVIVTVLVLAAVLAGCDYALYPCTFIRCDIHEVITNTYDDVFLGTSHGKINVDPETVTAVTGRSGHNLCVGGEYPSDTYYLTKLMIEKGHTPSRIIYEVSPGYFVSEKEEGNNYLLFYHEFPLSRAKAAYFADCIADCNLRTMLFPWYEYSLSTELRAVGDTVKRKWRRDYSADSFETDTQRYHASGFVERYPTDPATFSFEGMSEYRIEDLVDENLEDLDRLVKLCKDHGITLVAFYSPLPAVTLRQFSAGYEAMWAYFDQWFTSRGVPFLNFNGMELYGLTDHSVERFTDLDGHMNGDAARAFSTVLGQQLNGLL